MAIVKDLSAFPAVWSEALGKKRSTKKQEERLEENIAALNSPHFSVLSPQCPMNPGCDVAMLLRAGEKNAADTVDQRPKVLFLFATEKYCASSKSTPQMSSTSKALHALNGVVDYVKHCNIRRVCFVYCNPAVRDGTGAQMQQSYSLSEKTKKPNANKFKTLKDAMTELQRLRCTTSLHTVSTETEWRSLLDSLYLIVPDMDEESIVPNAPIPLRRARPVNGIKTKNS